MTMPSAPLALPSPTMVGDTAAGFTLVGAILNHIWTFLPGIVTVAGGIMAILWYGIQAWESKTCQDWHLRRLARRKAFKIAKLQAKQKVVAAQLDALELRRAAAATATELVATASAIATQEVARATNAQAVADIVSPTQKAAPQAPSAGRAVDIDPIKL